MIDLSGYSYFSSTNVPVASLFAAPENYTRPPWGCQSNSPRLNHNALPTVPTPVRRAAPYPGGLDRKALLAEPTPVRQAGPYPGRDQSPTDTQYKHRLSQRSSRVLLQ